jgi:hypothetical protein
MFVRWKFKGRLLKHMVNVQWTTGTWGNGVGCSKKAGLMCMTRNEVDAGLWSQMIWKSECKNSGKEAIHNFWITQTFFWPTRVWGVTKKKIRRAGQVWWWPFPTKAYKRWSHDMTSDSIYTTTMRRSSLHFLHATDTFFLDTSRVVTIILIKM